MQLVFITEGIEETQSKCQLSLMSVFLMSVNFNIAIKPKKVNQDPRSLGTLVSSSIPEQTVSI